MTPAQIELIARAQSFINGGGRAPAESITPDDRKMIYMTEEEFERSLQGKETIDQLSKRIRDAQQAEYNARREMMLKRIQKARREMGFDECLT